MAFDIARVHSSQRNGATGAFLLWLSKVSIEKLLKFRFAMQKWLFFLHVVLIEVRASWMTVNIFALVKSLLIKCAKMIY